MEDNVTPIKKPTDQEKLDELHATCSRLFFEYGQIGYQIKTLECQLGETEVKLRNANTEAYKLSARMRQEAAEKLQIEKNLEAKDEVRQ